MITHRVSVLVFVAALNAAAFASPPAPASKDTAISYPASKITVAGWDTLLSRTAVTDIVTGTTRNAVQQKLGRPPQKLSPDVWVYDNCRPDHPEAQADNCELLVIAFDGEKVSGMKFVNRPMVTLIAADIKAARGTYVANK